MKKAIFTLLIAASLASCSTEKQVYVANYYRTIRYGVVEVNQDYLFLKPKDTLCWDWYKETVMFEEYSPSSDSITIEHWGSLKDFRKASH